MNDTLTLRDHSKPCDHDHEDCTPMGVGSYFDEEQLAWVCTICPGGEEIVLIPDTIGGAKVGTYPDGEPMRLRKWRRWVTEWEADDAPLLDLDGSEFDNRG